ncbi:MAG: immunoglobulin-like domain-containing protein, partial [Bacilli bacterium]
VSDNYANLTVANVVKTGTININVVGTYVLTYTLTDGFNTTTATRTVIVKPLINQLLVYNPNDPTKYNGFNISFNRNFVVSDPSQIKIQYEYSIDGGAYVLANLVKYPGYVSSNPTYLQEEYNFFEDIIKRKTTTFYGMLNANGGKILYKKSWIVIESFQADTISKDVVVSMQEHNVQDRLRTAYKAIQSGKTVLIRTVLTFKLENGASVTYKLDPIKYN